MSSHATENTAAFPHHVDKEAINRLPLGRYEGPIYIVQTQEELELAVGDLAQETLLGFDTETRPSFQRGTSYPVSLVQMAGSQGVYLFHLTHLKDLSKLDALLENPAILKACVAVRDDVRKLRAVHDFNDAGFVEIGDAARRAGIDQTGLRNLCAIVLGVRISKSAQVTNWARPELTHAQIVYAATDAWVSRLLYKKLSACPPAPAAAAEPQEDAAQSSAEAAPAETEPLSAPAADSEPRAQ